ncbi:hypothetical protein BDV30DRAFT_212450 [Aspergillus minisclerotigenes]|uniref:Uncharacterized protein n=1 Tax=Aspergillus minisclerotigenes TaxID=656917 RepID=A0A5N6IZR1_9EURO|nr:hypothetical protein BDV30DRAFT_212450 [Aspergillus minisclerotigenes]
MKTCRQYTSCNAAEPLSSPESPGNIHNTRRLQLKPAMCYYLKDVYSCGCSERGPFIQCPIRRGTNSKCARLGAQQPRAVGNYCPNHLVGPAATVTYDQGRGGDGEKPEGQED